MVKDFKLNPYNLILNPAFKDGGKMSSEIYLTKEGRNKMLDELERLGKRKPLIQEELARAREHGDLKENAEYHAAKETLTKLGQRICEIESKLSRSKLISEQNIEKDKIFIGVTVTIKDISDGDISRRVDKSLMEYKDETGILASSFDAMLVRLNSEIDSQAGKGYGDDVYGFAWRNL